MKKIVATAAVAATLFSASVSEAGYQSTYDAEQRHPVMTSDQATEEQSGPVTVEDVPNVDVEQQVAVVSNDHQRPLFPDGITETTYYVEASSTKEAAISEAEKRQKMFAENGMIDEIVEIEATGYAEAGNLEAAMADMKRNAVENVLMQLRGSSGIQDSKYHELSDDNGKYINSTEFISAQTSEGMLAVKARVNVDKGVLLYDIVQMEKQANISSNSTIAQSDETLNQTSTPQENAIGNTSTNVCVYLRVVGSRDSKLNEVIANTSYDKALQAKRFNISVDNDAIQNGLDKYNELSYAEYCLLMRQRAINIGQGVNVVIVGEVVTEAVLSDETGITQRATVHMEVYDLTNNRQLGNMSSDYFARGMDGPSAEAAVVQKASDESARVIVQEIYKYVDGKKAYAV